jgi:hypothetical protein
MIPTQGRRFGERAVWCRGLSYSSWGGRGESQLGGLAPAWH